MLVERATKQTKVCCGRLVELLAFFSGQAAQTRFHPLVTMSWGSDLLVDAESSSQMRRLTEFTLANTDVLVGALVVSEHQCDNVNWGFADASAPRHPLRRKAHGHDKTVHLRDAGVRQSDARGDARIQIIFAASDTPVHHG